MACASEYPELDDPDWIRARLAEAGIARIATRLGTGHTVVYLALARHGITAPPQRSDHRTRITMLTDPVARYRAAGKLLEETDQTAEWAQAQQVAAVQELADAGHSASDIARRVGIGTARVRRMLARS